MKKINDYGSSKNERRSLRRKEEDQKEPNLALLGERCSTTHKMGTGILSLYGMTRGKRVKKRTEVPVESTKYQENRRQEAGGRHCQADRIPRNPAAGVLCNPGSWRWRVSWSYRSIDRWNDWLVVLGVPGSCLSIIGGCTLNYFCAQKVKFPFLSFSFSFPNFFFSFFPDFVGPMYCLHCPSITWRSPISSNSC